MSPKLSEILVPTYTVINPVEEGSRPGYEYHFPYTDLKHIQKTEKEEPIPEAETEPTTVAKTEPIPITTFVREITTFLLNS